MAQVLIPTPQEMLNRMITIYAAKLSQLGYPNPSVAPNSPIYLEFETLVNEFMMPLNNLQLTFDSVMPDSAVGSDLDRICNNYGLTRRIANPATGAVRISCTATTTVVAGSRLINKLGIIYTVDVGGNYSNNQIINLTCAQTGIVGNASVGSVFTWIDLPAYTANSAVVAVEFAGGTEIEDDDTLRNRLFNLLYNRPSFANWQDVVLLAENYNPQKIQKAFMYACANGPATQHLALAGYSVADPTNRGRDIDSTTLSQATSYIVGNLPGYTNTVVTTVANLTTTVSFQMNLPYPVGAVNLGTGGGWLDFTPFPQINALTSAHNGTTNFAYCFVSGITNSTTFTISSPLNTPPQAGITRISWVDRANNWIVQTSTIISYTGTGPYTVTVDVPFVGIAVNDAIFPAAESAQIYLDTALNYFSLLGPGEKTNISNLISRASRQPLPTINWFNNINANLLKQIENSGQEVLGCQFAARRIASGEIGNNAPPVVTNINDAPNIYTPFNLAFYPALN